MTFEIDVSELDALSRQLLDESPKQVRNAVRKVLVAEGQGVKSRAQALAPTDRPWLKQSIHMKTWNNPEGPAVSVFSELFDPEGRPVAVFVEHGTSRMPPQPFMTPAGSAAEGTLPSAVLAAVDPFGKGGSDE